MKKIRKAIIPVAGYGTRFLPIVKTIPKEMLPVIDKPVLQFIVEELVEAGIEQIVFVTSRYKKAIEDYFDYHPELEAVLRNSGKQDLAKEVRDIANMADFVFVRQKQQRGNGDAILCAKDIIGNEPFIALWGDEFISAKPSRTRQMITAYNKYQGAILSAMRTTKPEDKLKYGFARGEEIEPGLIKADELIEKPGPDKVTSDLAIVTAMISPPEIFQALEKKADKLKKGEELVYVDGLEEIKDQVQSYALEIKGGRYYDCGSKQGYLETIVESALKRPDLKEDFKKYLKTLKI